MSHLQKVTCYEEDGEREPIILGTAFAPRRQSKCVACIKGLASVMNTIILVMILLIVGHSAWKLHHELAELKRVVSVFTAGTPDPVMSNNVAKFLTSTAEAFFFGSSDGAIPTFLADSIFGFDFASLGTRVESLANQVENVMSNAPVSNTCSQYVTCPNEGPYRCTNGQQVWCNNAGDVVNCAIDTCVAPYIAAGASLVESVAQLVGKVEGVPVSNASAVPAFSNGLLRLDQILKWVESQANPAAWQSAAKACQLFTFRVKAINWVGAWVDTNGETRSWNANSQIRQIAGYLEQVCDPLAKLNTPTATNPKEKENTKKSSQ